jgi:hypothetical protein
MSSDPINEILSNKLPEITKIINKKIEELDRNRNIFNTNLTGRLEYILNLITIFKNTNFSELIKAKEEFTRVSEELKNTQNDLKTKNTEVAAARAEVLTLQQTLADNNNKILQLEQEIKECNENIARLVEQHTSEINKLTQENQTNFEQEKARLTEAHKQEVGKLNNEKTTLERQIEKINVEKEKFKTQLDEVNAKYVTLNEQLTQVITILNEHIDLLNGMTTNTPNIGEFQYILDKITSNLTDVINGINQPGPPPTTTTRPPESYGYDKIEGNFKKLVAYIEFLKLNGTTEPNIKKEFIEKFNKNIDGNPVKISNLDAGILLDVNTPRNKNEINNILQDKKLIIPDPDPPEKTGGKRKRKTMKKRDRTFETRNLGTRNLGTRNLGTRKIIKRQH